MNLLPLWIAVWTAACVLNTLKSSAGPVAPTVSLAEQEVIEALVGQHPRSEAHASTCIIKDTTWLWIPSWLQGNYSNYAEHLRKEAKDRPPEFKAALEDYLKKNRKETKIVFPTNAPPKIQLRSEDSLSGAVPGGGYFTISRVGIDPGRTVAIVYVSYMRGPADGKGGMCILRRGEFGWKLTRESFGVVGWVS